MAPFRNRDRSNRSGRGQIEHNVLEGLPINQYREVEVTVGTNTAENKQVDNDSYWPEQPMPRDSHLLPEYTQQILRAARSGRVYQRPAPADEDREIMDEEEEIKEVQHGFTVKKWVKVPRHLEDPEPEYLAKRRKGLPSQYATQPWTDPAPMRETKVKKLDAQGNVSVYKVLVPEGQTIAGEVQEAEAAIIEAAPAAAAPGTVVEGVGVVNAEGIVVASDLLQQTPPRRRPPIPKKKKRGPGRGKKKVVFVEGSADQPVPTAAGDLALNRLKDEASVEPSDGGDTPMRDAGDEEDGSDDDGSDDDDNEDVKQSPAPAQAATSSKTPAELTSAPAIEPLKEILEEPVVEPAPIPAAVSAVEPPLPVSVESTTPQDPAPPSASPFNPPVSAEPEAEPEKKERSSRDPSSSPEMPLAVAHSRQNSMNQIPTLPIDTFTLEPTSTAEIPTDATSVGSIPTDPILANGIPSDVIPKVAVPPEVIASEPAPALSMEAPVEEADGEDDLLGSLERHLDEDESMGGT